MLTWYTPVVSIGFAVALEIDIILVNIFQRPFTNLPLGVDRYWVQIKLDVFAK